MNGVPCCVIFSQYMDPSSRLDEQIIIKDNKTLLLSCMYNVYPAFNTAIKQAVSRELKSYQTSAGHKIYFLSRVFIHSFMNVTSFSQYVPLSGCKPR